MVGLRFQTAARAAGVEHVTAHSGRVGLASELTSRAAAPGVAAGGRSSRTLVLGRSLRDFMRKLGIKSNSGGARGDHGRILT